MAEGERFELSERLHAQRFSRPPRSTTPAPLRSLSDIIGDIRDRPAIAAGGGFLPHPPATLQPDVMYGFLPIFGPAQWLTRVAGGV